jgi:hypothetical protein
MKTGNASGTGKLLAPLFLACIRRLVSINNPHFQNSFLTFSSCWHMIGSSERE